MGCVPFKCILLFNINTALHGSLTYIFSFPLFDSANILIWGNLCTPKQNPSGRLLNGNEHKFLPSLYVSSLPQLPSRGDVFFFSITLNMGWFSVLLALQNAVEMMCESRLQGFVTSFLTSWSTVLKCHGRKPF